MKRYYLLVASLLCICMATHVTAKVTWLPDYLGDNKSYGANRVNDGGSNKSEKNCATYGLLDSCGAHQIGKGAQHPIAGLTCYEECVCDTSYYKYTRVNCLSPKKLSEGCSDLKKELATDGVVLKKSAVFARCDCPAEYNLSTCPTGMDCGLSCDGKYKTGTCKDGYTNQNGTCVKVENCSAYPLTVCPAGGTCSNCPDNSAKKKLDSCDTAKGWKLSNGTCVAVVCPAGYTAGIMSCTSGSTKPDYTQSGMSGGKVCGMCSCKNVNTSCTAANYPVTSIPANATKTSECSTGCGSEKVTRYTFTCNVGYVKSGNSCVKDCSDYTLTSCPDNAKCSQCDSKYKLENCNDGYYKATVNTTLDGSGSEQEYVCYYCDGTLVGKSDNCPAGTKGLSMYSAVDKKCCKTCSDAYNLDECPEHATCSECGGKYKVSKCDDGYYKVARLSLVKGTAATTTPTEKISCSYCKGKLVASTSSCATGYQTTTGVDQKCCSVGTSGGTTGGTGTSCPPQSQFNGKVILREQRDSKQNDTYVAWTSFLITTSETCEQFKTRIIEECGLTANIDCNQCICDSGITYGKISWCGKEGCASDRIY